VLGLLDPFQEESMLVNKSIQTLWLGFALCLFLWVGIGHTPTIAVTLTKAGAISQERMQTLPEPLNLQTDHVQ
jgi:hypothetical protein